MCELQTVKIQGIDSFFRRLSNSRLSLEILEQRINELVYFHNLKECENIVMKDRRTRDIEEVNKKIDEVNQLILSKNYESKANVDSNFDYRE